MNPFFHVVIALMAWTPPASPRTPGPPDHGTWWPPVQGDGCDSLGTPLLSDELDDPVFWAAPDSDYSFAHACYIPL